MHASAFLVRVAAAVALSLPALSAFPGPASAQITIGPTGPMGGGGGRRPGGGDFEIHDPCAYRDCFRRPPRPRYPRGPGVVIIPDDPYVYEEPFVYEEDLGPADPPPRKTQPKSKSKSKPKPKKAKQPEPKNDLADARGQVPGRDFRPDEVLVEFPLSTPQSEIDAIAQRNNIEQLGSQEIALLDVRLHRWRVVAGQSVEATALRLRGTAGVSDANLNRVFTLQLGAAKDGPPQYAAEKLRLAEAHALTRGDAVTVALIDSGADPDHPELKDVIAETHDVIGGTYASHAHGTGMAGAIAANDMVRGAAPKARILNVRAFAQNGKTQDGTTFDVVKGMDWAAQKGARVFNLSFAGPRDPLMSRVIEAAQKKGIVVIAAAGNAGPNSPPLFPAADKGVIAVTALDAEDGVMKMANRGSYVTMAAPGVDILLPSPDKAYAVSSGTSIATAYVSGIAALMIAKNPDADGEEIYEVLTGTARDLGDKGRDKEFGAGLADPVAALEAMEPIPQTVAAPVQAEQPVR